MPDQAVTPRRRRLRRLEQQARQVEREQELREAGASPLVAYWEARYATGGGSGAGSAGDAARRKAAYVDTLIRRERVGSVVDWGCGDGRQLDLLHLPPGYLGVDISASAVAACIARHPGRAFLVWPPTGPEVAVYADLAMSLDVIFHLVDDADFAGYWSRLFGSADRLVLVHSTDHDRAAARHVRHRRISHLAPAGWVLADRPADPATAGFYLWRRA